MHISGRPTDIRVSTPSAVDLELPEVRKLGDAPQSGNADAWKPWERQWTETALPLMGRMPRGWYHFRWAVWYPLQRRIFWGMVTIGETLLMLCLLGAAAGLMGGTWKNAGSSGQVAAIPLFLSFIFACHNSVWTFLLGLPFERSLTWHKAMAYLAVIMGLYHGLLSWYFGDGNGKQQGQGKYAGDWLLEITDKYFWSGWGLEGAMGLLVLTSMLPQLRRFIFQAWFYLHWALIIVTIAFAFIHGADTIIIGLVFWIIDMLLRYVWMAGFKNPHTVEIVALPGDVVRIAWPRKDFNYMGGQYVFICIPKLSLFEWHPFSLSSHPDADQVYLHVRVLGDWTRALHTLASKAPEGEPMQVKAYIEGPYGSPTIDICGPRHTMFLLISGGIGVTPMQSTLNELLTQHARGRPLKMVWFVWSVRDKHMISTVLDYNTKYAERQLPADLPRSFSPDLVSPNIRVSREVWGEQQMQVAQKQGQQQQQPPSEAEVGDFLHTEFYLTQVREASQYQQAGISPDKQSCVRFGRPDISAILVEAARVALLKEPKNPRIAVMVCGPASMVADVERMSHKLSSSSGVVFEFHKETFDF